MRRRDFIMGGAAVTMLTACATLEPEANVQEEKSELAPGTNRDFSFTIPTAHPEDVWRLWITPSTWGRWDRGLKSAQMEGQMALGSVGEIEPLSGPSSRFTVVEFNPKQSYAFETRLPGATLRVERSFNAARTAFTHRVTFSGLSAFIFAPIFGPGFRKALPPTMRALEKLAATN